MTVRGGIADSSASFQWPAPDCLFRSLHHVQVQARFYRTLKTLPGVRGARPRGVPQPVADVAGEQGFKRVVATSKTA